MGKKPTTSRVGVKVANLKQTHVICGKQAGRLAGWQAVAACWSPAAVAGGSEMLPTAAVAAAAGVNDRSQCCFRNELLL